MSEVIFSVFPSENFVDLGLYQFGWEQCDPSHSFGPAARNHYLFHYCLSGTGMLYSQNGRKESDTFHIKSGQGFMIFPHQVCMYIADHEIPWEYVWIEFDGLRVKEAIELAGLKPEQPVYKARYKDISETMKEEMLYIVNHKEESPFHLIGHLYLFIDSLVRSSTSVPLGQGSSLREFYLKEAISFIEQNFQNDISVEDIAACCGLNRSYFGKIFHENMGKSPQEFLISYRMTKAAELLKLTALSVADIGNAVGYPNQLHFSRAFKNVYAISPRQWRLEHGGGKQHK
ncbi:MAG: AraC family transcriptional regulator [Lachnospiraceae bacterium]|jgi:AraC-type DNA-binding domain-containing proteins|nr:AraC family transcriptional regulator [Lachnospiraceae bacterium]MCX4375935.1 AraC family transcriptional regulator [Lachnospiraceae bacterium]